MWCLAEAADCETELQSGYIGVELLSRRSDKQANGMDRLTVKYNSRHESNAANIRADM